MIAARGMPLLSKQVAGKYCKQEETTTLRQAQKKTDQISEFGAVLTVIQLG
jgi:hypothetical protein